MSDQPKLGTYVTIRKKPKQIATVAEASSSSSSKPSSPIAWLLGRLKNQCAITDDINEISVFEASLYGPLNTLLCTIFSVADHYMVKPQGILRKSPDNLDRKKNPAKSVNPLKSKPRASLGAPGGSIRYIPDFMIVKAGEKINTDVLISIFEIKKQDLSEKGRTAAERQLQEYLIHAVKTSGSWNLIKLLTGFLVIGSTTIKMELDVAELHAVMQPGNEFTAREISCVKRRTTYKTYSTEFAEELRRISNCYKGTTYPCNEIQA